jgi:hypothetical protein
VQDERVGIAAEFSHDEGHALDHQAGNEGDVAGKPVQLRHEDATLRPLGGRERSRELRSPNERIGTLAGLDVDVFGGNVQSLGLRETGNSCSLRLNSESGVPKSDGWPR